MKKIRKNLIMKVLALSLFVFSLIIPTISLAATSPSLGTTDTYGIISSTYTNSLNTPPETRITGDVCYTTPPGTAPISISGAVAVPCSPSVGSDQSSVLANITAQANDAAICTNLGTNVVLSGTYTPGCYTSTGSMDIVLNTTVTLDGLGTYIFRPQGALTTGADSSVLLINGASACNVFWAPVGDTTLGANSATSATPTFVGNIIQNALVAAQVRLGHFANLLGRVLAFGRTVTTDSNTIAIPVCAGGGTINVTNVVINNNGGTKTVADFPLFVSGVPVISGYVNVFSPATYNITETANSNYTQTFSGDCDVIDGHINLIAGDTKVCTITNDDQGPSITVNKVVVNDNGGIRSVSSFPLFVDLNLVMSGISNMFTVGNHTISETSDSNYFQTFSGDCDNNGILNLIFGDNKSCTITNNDVAPVSHQASGSYVSNLPTNPVVVNANQTLPVIRVTKVPNLTLLLKEGGDITYVEKITNPGIIDLSNIKISDDKCAPVKYVSGDIDNNLKLSSNETWTYTCKSNISKTTTNTVTVKGEANGIIVRDSSVATVTVPSVVPGLPKTGFPPEENDTVNSIMYLVASGLVLISVIMILRKHTT